MSFIIGLLISFFSSFNPGILSLTTLKIGILKGKTSGYLFSIGVSLVIAFQAYISLEFASFINENPFIERNIQIIGGVIFFILSIYFFSLGKGKKEEQSTSETDNKNPFWQGVTIALLNVFSIAFYAGTGLGLNYGGWLEFNTFDMISFSIGSALGSLAFLMLIVLAAKTIDAKVALISNNINYILGVVTGFVAIFTLYNIY